MGSNQSKLCSGVPEREYRRAEQDRIPWLYRRQQQIPSDTAEDTVHIHCSEDDVDQYMQETNAATIMFHFKVVKSPVIQPENSLEGGETQPLAKTPGTAEIASPVLVDAKIAEPGDVVVRPAAGADVVVRSEPSGDILVGTDAQPTELDLPLACLCTKVVRALHVVEKSFRDSLERTKENSAVDALSPSSTEPQLSTTVSDSQTMSPPVAVAEPWKAGDVHCPNEQALLVNDQKAPCEMDLELAAKDVLRTSEEPTPGQAQLDEASSEAPPHLVSAETSDERSDVKTHLKTKEVTELMLSLGEDLPQAVSEPHLILSEMEEEGPKGYCDVGTRLEALGMRGQREMVAVVDSVHETGRPTASRIFQNSELKLLRSQEAVGASCEKINAADVLLADDAVNFDSDEAVPAPATVKLDEHQTSVVQTMEAQPPTDIAGMSMAPSSPRAPLENDEALEVGPGRNLSRPAPVRPMYK